MHFDIVDVGACGRGIPVEGAVPAGGPVCRNEIIPFEHFIAIPVEDDHMPDNGNPFNGKDIVAVFLIQAIIIGFLGAILGIFIGFSISYILSITPFDTGNNPFISLKFFPVIFRLKYYVFGVVFGIITTLLAGFFPSRKASKIDPVAILRG